MWAMLSSHPAIIGPFEGQWEFLSNFAPTPILWRGRLWPTVEHAFQAAKTDVQEERRAIWHARTPGQAKRLGRKATKRATWEQERLVVMAELLALKFEAGNVLATKLLATGETEIVELNHWHDQFWGSCTCPRCGSNGWNMLGKLLQERRALLRAL